MASRQWASDDVLHRIIDANANRVREGLRVVEDFIRFALDDADLTARLKGLRHAVTTALEELDLEGQLLNARESATDVGAESYPTEEALRDDHAAIITANFRRAEEGLRVLEEFSKLVNPDTARAFKRMRFQTYALEKSVAGLLDSLGKGPS